MLVTILTLTAVTAALFAMGQFLSAYGIGNGFALLMLTNVGTSIWKRIATTRRCFRRLPDAGVEPSPGRGPDRAGAPLRPQGRGPVDSGIPAGRRAGPVERHGRGSPCLPLGVRTPRVPRTFEDRSDRAGAGHGPALLMADVSSVQQSPPPGGEPVRSGRVSGRACGGPAAPGRRRDGAPHPRQRRRAGLAGVSAQRDRVLVRLPGHSLPGGHRARPLGPVPVPAAEPPRRPSSSSSTTSTFPTGWRSGCRRRGSRPWRAGINSGRSTSSSARCSRSTCSSPRSSSARPARCWRSSRRPARSARSRPAASAAPSPGSSPAARARR